MKTFFLRNNYCVLDLFWITWGIWLVQRDRVLEGLICLVGGSIVTAVLQGHFLPGGR